MKMATLTDQLEQLRSALPSSQESGVLSLRGSCHGSLSGGFGGRGDVQSVQLEQEAGRGRPLLPRFAQSRGRL